MIANVEKEKSRIIKITIELVMSKGVKLSSKIRVVEIIKSPNIVCRFIAEIMFYTCCQRSDAIASAGLNCCSTLCQHYLSRFSGNVS